MRSRPAPAVAAAAPRAAQPARPNSIPPPVRVAVAVAPAPAPPRAPAPAPARARARRTRAATRTRTAHASVWALLRLPVTFAVHGVLGLALGLVLALTAPLAVGMRPLVVLSGSMEPVLHVGDVTVVRRITAAEARVGDVVTFKAPATGRVTTHRLRAVRAADRGRYAFTTKGDANNAFERWTLPADGQLSRAVYTVPLVGHALLVIRTPLGWTLLVGMPLLVLAVQEIRRIWRAAPTAEAADAPLAA